MRQNIALDYFCYVLSIFAHVVCILANEHTEIDSACRM